MRPLPGKYVAEEPLALNAPARLKPAAVAETMGVKMTLEEFGPETLAETNGPGYQTGKLVGLKAKVASPIVQLPREMIDANDPVTHAVDARANPGKTKRVAKSRP
jgi:hypothetical protein